MSVSEDDTLQPKPPTNLLSWMTMYWIQRLTKLLPPKKRRHQHHSKRRPRKSLKTVHFKTDDKSTADDARPHDPSANLTTLPEAVMVRARGRTRPLCMVAERANKAEEATEAGEASDETAPRGRGGLLGRGQDNRSAPRRRQHNGFAEAGQENGASETPRVMNRTEDQEGEAPPEEVSAPANNSPTPAKEDTIQEHEEPREIVLKEYCEFQSYNKKENNFKIRKFGEGCEKKWGEREGYFLNKANNQKETSVVDANYVTDKRENSKWTIANGKWHKLSESIRTSH